MAFSEYTNKNIQEVFKILKTSESGLLNKEALLRQQEFGLNEIKEGGINIVAILARQARSPFFYLLLIAGMTAFFIGEKIDGAVVFIFIAANVAIGFIQEFKAERTIFLLKNIISQKIKVLRGNKEAIIEKKHLVPGDLVLLVPGDIVPAELRIFALQNFLVDESFLK